HTYNTAKTYNVSLTVTDAGGASTTVTTTAVVSANAIVVSAGPNKSGNEGSATQFAGTASGGVGTLTYAWAFRHRGTPPPSPTPPGTPPPPPPSLPPAPTPATLTVTDGQGTSASATATVTVNNVAPTVGSGGPYSGTAGGSIKFVPTVTDPDPTDTFTYAWNF